MPPGGPSVQPRTQIPGYSQVSCFQSGVPLTCSSVIASAFLVTCVCSRSSQPLVPANAASMRANRSPFSPMLLFSVVILVSVLSSPAPIWFRNAANSAFVVLITRASSPRTASTLRSTNKVAPMTVAPTVLRMMTMPPTVVNVSFHRVRNTLRVFRPDVFAPSVVGLLISSLRRTCAAAFGGLLPIPFPLFSGASGTPRPVLLLVFCVAIPTHLPIPGTSR